MGDEMNLLLAASAFNLKKWMNHFLLLVFMVRIAYFIYALTHIRREQRDRYADLYLLIYRLW